MKKLSLLFAVAAMFVFAGCGKYEEGPGFSLRSKESRVAGIWEIEKYYEDGVDMTADILADGSSITIEFTKDGDYVITSSYTFLGQTYTETETGTWALTNNNADLTLTDTQGVASSVKILRLTNSELWYVDSSSGTVDEVHLKAK
jgi:hypothetical protein